MASKQKFTDSLALMPDLEDEERMQARRLATYSMDALRAGWAVDKIFVQHPDFSIAVNALDRVFQLGRELAMPQGMCLIGPSGVGKTSVIKYFMASLPESPMYAKKHAVLTLRAHERSTLGYIVSTLLRAIDYPIVGVNARQLYRQRTVLIAALHAYNTRLLFIDEAHRLLRVSDRTALSTRDHEIAEFVCEVMDEAGVGVVLAGTDRLVDLMEKDSHLASRIPGMYRLQPFQPGPQWIGFIRAFIKQCTVFDLKPLGSGNLPSGLWAATGGSPRGTKRLITEAVLLSWQKGHAEFDPSSLAQAYQLVYGHSTPRSNPFE